MKLARIGLLPTLLLISGAVQAQFGPKAVVVPTTPEQQTVINQAVAYLESTGESLAGVTITNVDIVGNAPGISTQDGLHIGIDFARLEAVVPPGTPGAPGHPGLAIVVMYHEILHFRHALPQTFCGELTTAILTCSMQCNFITTIHDDGGGPLDALCMMYQHVRNLVNESGFQEAAANAGCLGTTTIPPCGLCPF